MIHSPGKRGTSVDQSDKVFDTESMESGVELTPKTGPQGRGGGTCDAPYLLLCLQAAEVHF